MGAWGGIVAKCCRCRYVAMPVPDFPYSWGVEWNIFL